MSNKTASIVLDEELFDRLDAIAARDGVSRSQVIRETLEMALHVRAELGVPKLPRLNMPEA